MKYTPRGLRHGAVPAAAVLVTMIALAPVRSSHADLSAECQAAVKQVADTATNRYLCVRGRGTACHLTSTRVAPVFLGDPTGYVDAPQPQKKLKSKLETFEDIYKDICGNEYKAGAGTCVPRASAVYQLVYDDYTEEKKKGSQEDSGGHSILLACVKDKGCAVFQGVANVYTLNDWITAAPAGQRGVVTLVPGVAERFGKMQLLDGAKLHEWLGLAGGWVRDDGTLESFKAFWVCDGGKALCDLVLAGNFRKFATDEKKAARIIGTKFAWDGQCHDLERVRMHGFAYADRWCTDVRPERMNTCTFGLGQKMSAWKDVFGADSYAIPDGALPKSVMDLLEAKPGYLPISVEYYTHLAYDDPMPPVKYECEPR